MSLLEATALTMADWSKRVDPNGKVPTIIELLSQTNEILEDMLFIEGNLPTGHRTHVRTGLPTVAWKLINKGTVPSKGATAQIDEAIGIMEAWSEVDKDLAELNGNVSAFRLMEAKSFIEAMNQEMASTLFYGNSSVSPEEFTGLAPRYSDLSAVNGQNILDAGGAGSDNSSIYLVCWGEHSVHGIFPKGSMTGLQHQDHGLVTVQDDTKIGTARLRVYQEQFNWKTGIALRDWRYVVRIANISTTDLAARAGAEADLVTLMIKAMNRLPSMNMGKCAFYMNRTVQEGLDLERVAKSSYFNESHVEGKRVNNFRGIPVRLCDSLLSTEGQVV